LSGVDLSQRLHGFDLNNEPSPNKQIEPPIPDVRALVTDRQRHLPFERKFPESKFNAQCLFVYQFEKSGPQDAMNFDRSPDYLVRKPIQFIIRLFIHPINHTESNCLLANLPLASLAAWRFNFPAPEFLANLRLHQPQIDADLVNRI